MNRSNFLECAQFNLGLYLSQDERRGAGLCLTI